jgi:hypothetical protein
MNCELLCHHCEKLFERRLILVLRSPEDSPDFCSRPCFWEHRKKHKTDSQKKAEKAEYDQRYRATNIASIKAKKAAYFQKTYDPEKARMERKKGMPLHVQYCRQPWYREYKQTYDQNRRSKKYGAFAESHKLLIQIEKEIGTRMSDYEIRLQNKTLNKNQNRKRAHHAQSTHH